MAGKIRYVVLTVAALLLIAGGSGVGYATEITGISMSVTSGTLVLQRIEADNATILDDDGAVLAEGLRLQMRYASGETAEARSDTGVLIISGDKSLGGRVDAAELDGAYISRYGAEFREIRFPGDIMLGGPDGSTEATIGDNGEVDSRQIIWSELYQRFLLPRAFHQRTVMDNGTTLQVSGATASISRDFNNCSYFGDAETDVVMIVERALEPEGTN